MRDWKTSLVGAALILCGVALFAFGPDEHKADSSVVILAGVGFIVARDSGNKMPPRQDPPKG